MHLRRNGRKRLLGLPQPSNQARPVIEPLEARTLLDALPLADGGLLMLPPGVVQPPTAVPAESASGLGSNIEHNKPFTESLARFHDHDLLDPSAYIALITWDDGQTSQGTILPADHGEFNVLGSHTLPWGYHSATVQITKPVDPAWILTASASINSIPPAYVGKAFDVFAISGHYYSGTIATYAGVDTAYLDRYYATISWGDGSCDRTATLVAAGSDVVNVSAEHLYFEPGLYDVQVNLYQKSSALPPPSNAIVPAWADPFIEAHSRANARPGEFTGEIDSTEIIDSMPFDGPVAWFYPDAQMSFRYLRAKVEFVPYASSDPISLPSTVVDEDGVLRVDVGYTFMGPGTLSVYVYDKRLPGHAGVVGAVRQYIDPVSHLSVTATPFTAIAGQVFWGKVGELTSQGAGTFWSSTFTGAISWGDGSESDLQFIPSRRGGYDLYATHIYGGVGDARTVFPVLRVTETRTRIDPALPAGQFTYYGGDYVHGRSQVKSGVIGLLLRPWSSSSYVNNIASVAVAQMIVEDPQLPAGSYTGTIAWDDGTAESVSFYRDPLRNDLFYVVASRLFSAKGSCSGTLTVTGASVSQSVRVTTYVTDPTPPPPPPIPPLGSMALLPISAVEARPWVSVLGRFTPTDFSIPIGDYTVNIDWGDGSGRTPGLLTAAGDGSFIISGSHTYTTPWPATYYVGITCGNQYISASESVDVEPDPTIIHAQPRSIPSFRQRERFTTVVATFTPPEDIADPAAFSANIDWGDGTTSTGVITSDYEGGFDISGTRVYEKSGYFDVTVTILGPGGPATVKSSIYIERNPVVLQKAVPSFAGLSIDGMLATFYDEDAPTIHPAFFRSNYAALVDWGDGSYSTGAINLANAGNCNVTGQHVYPHAGEYTVEVIVRRNNRGVYDYRKVEYTHRGEALVYAANDAYVPTDSSEKLRVRFRVRVGGRGAGVIPVPEFARVQPTASLVAKPESAYKPHRKPKAHKPAAHTRSHASASAPPRVSALEGRQSIARHFSAWRTAATNEPARPL